MRLYSRAYGALILLATQWRWPRVSLMSILNFEENTKIYIIGSRISIFILSDYLGIYLECSPGRSMKQHNFKVGRVLGSARILHRHV
jgi:hypothetical protein